MRLRTVWKDDIQRGRPSSPLGSRSFERSCTAQVRRAGQAAFQGEDHRGPDLKIWP